MYTCIDVYMYICIRMYADIYIYIYISISILAVHILCCHPATRSFAVDVGKEQALHCSNKEALKKS